ncbi:MAG: ParB N-terminal domain-containing protein [Thermodesulfovibrionia bacterium]|nr:ParB N-terminal domain-containing protein [Thermodesulfovibrionia bacterium]
MDEKILQLNTALEEINAPYRVDFVDPAKIRTLEKNARYMSQAMFQNLVDNIKRDGGLTSLPLCVKEDDCYKVLSGNHRVKASAAAGIEKVMILYIDKPTNHQEEVAIQLSHNAIAGQDDPVILKELWSEIEDIDLKIYSGLDTELLHDLEKMDFLSISESSPDFKQVAFAFLPEEVDQLKELMEDVSLLFSGSENFILSRRHYEEVFNVLVDVKDQFSIVNNPTALVKIFELAREQMGMMK